jgi:hypothetical protein
MGFSPKPNPKLIATYKTHGPAVAVSRGLDRDRVVDETGNQTVVFGRRGSRPFTKREMEKFTGPAASPYRVEDVTVRDGELQTKSGAELKPTGRFQPEPPPAQTQLQNRERLVRRGK